MLPFLVILTTRFSFAGVSKSLYQLFTHNTTTSYASLHYILRQNCTRLINASNGKWSRKNIHTSSECARLSSDILLWLDFNTVATPTGVNVFVSFQDELLQLPYQVKVYFALKHLKTQIRLHQLNSLEQVDLFTTLNSVLQDEHLTRTTIAVLFQDTSKQMIHLKWLSTQLNTELESNPELNQFFLLVLELNQSVRKLEKSSDLFVYKNNPLSSGVYHYFVPNYLTAKAERAGYSKKYSYLAGFLINYLYEKISNQNPFTALTSPNAAVKNKDDLADMCFASAGSMRVLTDKEFNYSVCINELATKPNEYIISTLNTLSTENN